MGFANILNLLRCHMIKTWRVSCQKMGQHFSVRFTRWFKPFKNTRLLLVEYERMTALMTYDGRPPMDRLRTHMAGFGSRAACCHTTSRHTMMCHWCMSTITLCTRQSMYITIILVVVLAGLLTHSETAIWIAICSHLAL